MHAPFDNADSQGCRSDRVAGTAPPTVNPGDDDDDDEEEGGGSGGGSIDPEEDEGYDDEEDEDDEDPLWAGCIAAHHNGDPALPVAEASYFAASLSPA